GDERVFVGRRQEHTTMTVRAGIDADGGAGALEVRVDPAHRFALEVEGTRVRAVARVGPLTTVLGEAPLTPDTVLELRVVPPTAPEYSRERGPDVVVAAVRTPEGATELARIDGRYLSTEVAGGFTGRMVGVSCGPGEIGVRFVEYLGGA
ncbi:beta-xylosidase family glycoside hydrolase, partial [Nocardiopsis alborubida]